MATKRGRPQGRSREKSLARADADTGSLPDVVAQTIDAERTKLMQAHAVLKCLYEVLLHTDDEDAQYCADSVKVVAKLLDDSAARLDPARISIG